MNEHETEQGRAFEYVSGTLDKFERAEYEALLADSAEERALVKFWQEQLLVLDLQAGTLAPQASTWKKVEDAIAPTPYPKAWQNGFIKNFRLAWTTATVAILLLVTVLLKPLIIPGAPSPHNTLPNTDYIAVMTNENGEAILTALTTAQNNLMWLQWTDTPLLNEGENSLQLWAVSKRDGQTRSLAVFDDVTPSVTLDEAALRLVTDASFLILTLEESGGSSIDEPAEEILAKGICVRFKGDEA